jgi:hypothetical protein
VACEHLIWLDNNLKVTHLRTEHDWDGYNRGTLIFKRLEKFNSYFKNIIKSHRIIEVSDTALHLMHPFRSYEYGHFFDTFQKTYCLSKLPDFSSIILSNSEKVNFFQSHLNVSGLQNKNLLRIDKDKDILFYVKKLIYIYPPSPPQIFLTNL